MSTPTKEKEKDVVNSKQRWLELLVVPAMLLLFGFLFYHQSAGTGFFTGKFGPLERVCLYGPIFMSLIPPVVRATTGRRNPARPFEAATSLSLAAGSLWLFIVFPFDFSHLTDPLPGVIQGVFSWMTDGVGKVLLIFQVIIGPLSAIAAILRFRSVRRQQSEPSS